MLYYHHTYSEKLSIMYKGILWDFRLSNKFIKFENVHFHDACTHGVDVCLFESKKFALKLDIRIGVRWITVDKFCLSLLKFIVHWQSQTLPDHYRNDLLQFLYSERKLDAHTLKRWRAVLSHKLRTLHVLCNFQLYCSLITQNMQITSCL